PVALCDGPGNQIFRPYITVTAAPRLPKGITMNKFKINAIAVAIGLAFCAGAMAQALTKDEYKAQKTAIADQYKSGKVACASFAANVKDICMAEAKGKENV